MDPADIKGRHEDGTMRNWEGGVGCIAAGKISFVLRNEQHIATSDGKSRKMLFKVNFARVLS